MARVAVCCAFLTIVNIGASSLAAPDSSSGVVWLSDYGLAMKKAKASQKLLCIRFYDQGREIDLSEEALFDELAVRESLEDYVLARVPIDAKISLDDQEMALLDHAAFAEMRHSPGISIIDVTDSASPHYGMVVTVYPLNQRRPLNRGHLRVLLRLPRGSLTQRTLIFAVRTHPDSPKSANGEFYSLLASESESHSIHQASITTQGHHQWESRFHRINAKLPMGMLAQEVCAESWPDQDLVDAAEECVHSWRQSAGHWSAVSSEQNLFSYDMKRGSNGVWYATGLFARRR